MGAVLAGSLTVIGVEAVRYCDPYAVWRAGNGECVGITDGSFTFNKRLESAERRIHRLNDDALHSGRPYVTVVYLGPMSVDPGACGGPAGSVMFMVRPPPGVSSGVICPPIASVSPRDSARPRPTPVSLSRSPSRWNGVKIRSRSPGAMPGR